MVSGLTRVCSSHSPPPPMRKASVMVSAAEAVPRAVGRQRVRVNASLGSLGPHTADALDAALEAGKTFHVWAKPMLDSYIFLGGSGATLGLIIAIFLASRRPDYRQVAKLALPSGLFQINEPILFGLPIIMNPVMFIPFILVQPILAAITLAAYYSGIIPPITNIAPWTMPTGLGAFFNTNGSVAALLVALFNLGIATLVYLPFVVVANKAQNVIDQEESEEDIANALKF